MEAREIIGVSLDITFGNNPKKSLKDFINKALDQGEYYDGFEIAISKNDLDYKEYEELYKAFNGAYVADIPNLEEVRKLIDEYLTQSYFANTSWLVSNLGEIYATDGLRVAKIFNNKLIWVTKRVSFDGINLHTLTDEEVIGQWYSPIDDVNPWKELRLATKDGALLKGKIIEF
jgi:hypothetical protein